MAGHNEVNNPFKVDKTHKKVDNPFEVDDSTSDTSKFDTLIEKFENDGSFLLGVYAGELTDIRETFNEENLRVFDTLMAKLSQAKDDDAVKRVMGQIKDLKESYTDSSGDVVKGTKEEESSFSRIIKGTKNVVGSAADKLKPRVITNEEFAQITGIDINGSQSVGELAESIKKFGSRISKGELGRNLDDDQRQAILDQLSQIIEGKEDAEEIGYRQIENYFDGLARNIKKRGGKFIVTLEKGVRKSFDSQADAVKYVKDLKSSAEFQFQSGLRTFMEYTFIGAGNAFLKAEGLIWSIPGKLKEWGSEWLTLDIVSLDNLLAVGLYLGSAAIGFAILSAHGAIPIGVASSFWRRVVTDNLQKYNSNLQYTDYARGQGGQALDMSSPEGRDFMEMKQRQQIMDLVWADLETNYAQGSKKYNEYRRVIEKIDSYKLNRTPTFYYLAYKYGKLSGKISRFRFSIASIALRGARFYYPDFERDDTGNKTSKLPIWKLDYISFEDSKSLASKTLTELLDIETIRQGIEIFYKNKTVDRVSKDKEPPKIEVDGDDTKTDKYMQVIDEINARNIPESEKKKLLKHFDDYVNRLIDFPKSPKVMARDLYILLNTDHGQKSDFVRQLHTKINKRKENNGRIQNSLGKAGKGKLGRFNAFLSLVERGEWVGSKKEFDVEIKKIEARSDYKVSPNYDSRLGSVDFDQELQDTFDRGDSAAKTHKIVLGEFYDNTRVGSGDSMHGKDFDSAATYETELMKGIQDYIDFGIHNDVLENFAKGEVKEMFDKIISGKIMIEDENRLFAEIDNIFKGNIPSYKLVARLNDIVEANKKHKNIDDVKNLYEEAKKGRLNMTPKDLLELERNLGSFDYTVDRSRGVPLMEKSRMERLVADTQGWRNFDYNKTFGLSENATTSDYLDKLKVNFSGELELLTAIDIVEGTSSKSGVITELGEFAKALSENKYSKGQADHILKEIFGGKSFSSITLPMIGDKADFYNGESELSNKLDREWSKLSNDEKIEKAKKLKSERNFDETKITVIDIQKALKDIEGASEAETLKNNNIAEIKRLTNEVSAAKGERTLYTTYDSFQRIISDKTRNINVSEEPFVTLITNFNDAFETNEKNLGLGKTPKPVPDTSPNPVKPREGSDIGEMLIQSLKKQGNQMIEALAIEIELRGETDVSERVQGFKLALGKEILNGKVINIDDVKTKVEEIGEVSYGFKGKIRPLAEIAKAIKSQEEVTKAMGNLIDEKLAKSSTSFWEYLRDGFKDGKILRNGV